MKVSGSQSHFHTSVVNIVAINIAVTGLAALWFSSGVQMCPVCAVLMWEQQVRSNWSPQALKQ